jgi:hypothetical protein
MHVILPVAGWPATRLGRESACQYMPSGPMVCCRPLGVRGYFCAWPGTAASFSWEVTKSLHPFGKRPPIPEPSPQPRSRARLKTLVVSLSYLDASVQAEASGIPIGRVDQYMLPERDRTGTRRLFTQRRASLLAGTGHASASITPLLARGVARLSCNACPKPA